MWSQYGNTLPIVGMSRPSASVTRILPFVEKEERPIRLYVSRRTSPVITINMALKSAGEVGKMQTSTIIGIILGLSEYFIAWWSYWLDNM